MLDAKRDLPPELIRVDGIAESWRADLIVRLHPRSDVAIYQLVATANAALAMMADVLLPARASDWEIASRNVLEGLRFALGGVRHVPRPEAFLRDIVDSSLSSQDLANAHLAITRMSEYAKARDLFLSYAWGAYEIITSTPNLIRFKDATDWPGLRDHAERVITQEVKMEVARTRAPVLGDLVSAALASPIDLPAELDFGGLQARAAARAWVLMGARFAQDWMRGTTPVLDLKALVREVCVTTGLTDVQGHHFVQLTTLGLCDLRLGLMHCPIIELTASSRAVVPAGFLLGNPNVTLARLFQLRGPGLGAFSNIVEADLLRRLREHFAAPGTIIRQRVHYEAGGKKRDIDLLFYECLGNRAIVAQAKAFVPPDSVEDVVRANQSLRKAISQLDDAYRWVSGLSLPAWRELLGSPMLSALPEIHRVVIGNGFPGSDYVEMPPGMLIVGADYLLLPRFRGGSFLDAARAFQTRLEEVQDAVRGHAETQIIELRIGDHITVQAPAQDLRIG